MASVELALLIVVLLVGLVLGGLLAWSSLLTYGGHRPVRGAPEAAREAEAGTARALLGAALAVLAAALLSLLLVPGSVRGLPSAEDVPGGAFTLAFAALIVVVAFALPSWLGVRR